jgi:hypothetical protein
MKALLPVRKKQPRRAKHSEQHAEDTAPRPADAAARREREPRPPAEQREERPHGPRGRRDRRAQHDRGKGKQPASSQPRSPKDTGSSQPLNTQLAEQLAALKAKLR